MVLEVWRAKSKEKQANCSSQDINNFACEAPVCHKDTWETLAERRAILKYTYWDLLFWGNAPKTYFGRRSNHELLVCRGWKVECSKDTRKAGKLWQTGNQSTCWVRRFKEALSVLMLCAPVFIFTSGSSALLGRPRCGLSIWLSLLAIFNTLFWVYANCFHEKTDKTRKYSKSAIFVWYENGRRQLVCAQSINTERASCWESSNRTHVNLEKLGA